MARLAAATFCTAMATLCAFAEVTEIFVTSTEVRRSSDFVYEAPSTITSTLGLAAGLAVDEAGGKLYWSENVTAQILRADLDGSNEETILGALSGPEGIAVDSTNGKLYWADSSANAIYRANLDGTAQETLASSLSTPTGIALDLINGKVYWTNEGNDTIGRANLDGSSPETYAGTMPGLTGAIAVDGARGKFYWYESGDGSLHSADLDGTNDTAIGVIGANVAGLYLDIAENLLFASTALDGGLIQRINLDNGLRLAALTTSGTAPALAYDVSNETLYWPEPPTTSIAGVSFAAGERLTELSVGGADIEVDESGGKLYWADWDLVSAGASITRSNLDGGNAEVLFPSEMGVYGIAVDGAANRLYWADFSLSAIYRSALDGSSRETLLSGGLVTNPAAIEIDPGAAKMYWTNTSSGEIARANLDGSNAEIVLNGLGTPFALAIDTAHGKMYWADWAADQIRHANLDGSSVETVLSTLDFVFDIEIDAFDGALHWTQAAANTPAELRKANLDGTNITLLAREGLWPRGLALRTQAGSGFAGVITSNIPPGQIREGDFLVLTAPTGTGYQWKKNGAVLTGETNGTMTFAQVQTSHNGAYTVQYDNGAKAVVETTPFAFTAISLSSLPLSWVTVSACFAMFCVAFLFVRARRQPH